MFLLALCLFFCSPDPLDRLEKEALSFTSWEQVYDAPAGTSRALELQQLERIVVQVLGVQVMQGAPPGLAGVAMRGNGVRAIALDDSLSPNAQLQVLAHEAGHILQPPGLSASEGQVFADAVAFLVTGDDVRIFARYLAGHKNGLGVLKTYRREIEWAATVLRGK